MRLNVFIIILLISLTLLPMNISSSVSKTSYSDFPKLNTIASNVRGINPAPSGEKIEFYGYPINQIWYNSASIIIFEHGFIYKETEHFVGMEILLILP